MVRKADGSKSGKLRSNRMKKFEITKKLRANRMKRPYTKIPYNRSKKEYAILNVPI